MRALWVVAAAVCLSVTACSGLEGVNSDDDLDATTTTTESAVAAEDTSSTTAGDDTEAEDAPAAAVTPTDAAGGCDALAGLPYPERVDLVGRLDAALIAEMRSTCQDELSEMAGIALVASRAALLDRPEWFVPGLGEQECTEDDVTVPYRNTFDFAIRLIAVAGYDSNGTIYGTTWTVSDPIDSGEEVSLDLDVDGFDVIDGSSCFVEIQGFVEPDLDGGEPVDSWDPALGLAGDLPATDTDDLGAVVGELLDAEESTAQAGSWVESGSFEDVRSKNYLGLVDREGPEAITTGDVVQICVVDEIEDDLVAVVWEFDPSVDFGATLGVFHRSEADGRWRWVHTGIRVHRESSCDPAAA